MAITFAEWLRTDRESRGMTQNEYSSWLGVSHVTVSKYEQPGVEPETTFLQIVSRRTNKDIGFLASIAFPNAVHNINVEIMELAQEIEMLPRIEWEILRALIKGKLFKEVKNVSKESKRTGSDSGDSK